MRVLVTGASGFLAGRLIAALAARGETVQATSRTAPRAPRTLPPGVVFAPLDVLDFDAVCDLLAQARPTVVYHLAATSVLQAVATDGPRAMLQTNVTGTENVLEAARQTGVEAVVVASSDKQYGALASPPYDDDDTTAFANGGVYELSKAQQDQVARLYAGLYDAPAVRVARLVNLYGPGDTHWTRLIPGTIRRTLAGEAPVIRAGAGSALREYLFVDDAVAALIALAGDARARGNTPHRRAKGKLAAVGFNVASGHAFSAPDVIAAVQRVLADDFGVVGPPPQIVPADPGVFEPGSQFNDGGKLRTLLPEWAPRGLDDGLRATIPWYREYLRHVHR